MNFTHLAIGYGQRGFAPMFVNCGPGKRRNVIPVFGISFVIMILGLGNAMSTYHIFRGLLAVTISSYLGYLYGLVLLGIALFYLGAQGVKRYGQIDLTRVMEICTLRRVSILAFWHSFGGVVCGRVTYSIRLGGLYFHMAIVSSDPQAGLFTLHGRLYTALFIGVPVQGVRAHRFIGVLFTSGVLQRGPFPFTRFGGLIGYLLL